MKSVGFHKLSGDSTGYCAMTVNGPWRFCCRSKNGNVYEAEIIDYTIGDEYNDANSSSLKFKDQKIKESRLPGFLVSRPAGFRQT